MLHFFSAVGYYKFITHLTGLNRMPLSGIVSPYFKKKKSLLLPRLSPLVRLPTAKCHRNETVKPRFSRRNTNVFNWKVHCNSFRPRRGFHPPRFKPQDLLPFLKNSTELQHQRTGGSESPEWQQPSECRRSCNVGCLVKDDYSKVPLKVTTHCSSTCIPLSPPVQNTATS